jgi:hypothetical protein
MSSPEQHIPGQGGSERGGDAPPEFVQGSSEAPPEPQADASTRAERLQWIAQLNAASQRYEARQRHQERLRFFAASEAPPEPRADVSTRAEILRAATRLVLISRTMPLLERMTLMRRALEGVQLPSQGRQETLEQWGSRLIRNTGRGDSLAETAGQGGPERGGDAPPEFVQGSSEAPPEPQRTQPAERPVLDQTNSHYPSDVTDEQWNAIRPRVPTRDTSDPYPYDERVIVNALRYLYMRHVEGLLVDTDELPRGFPPRNEVESHFHEWIGPGPGRSPLEDDVFMGLPPDPWLERDLDSADPQPDGLAEEALVNQAPAESVRVSSSVANLDNRWQESQEQEPGGQQSRDARVVATHARVVATREQEQADRSREDRGHGL